jgi:cytoskeletal protein CcmA (bactofilin family)
VASPVRIGGDTLLDDTEVSGEADLDFRASWLGGNLSLRKVRAKRVKLPKVQVQGSLDVSGARITHLDASEMILRGDLSVEEGTAELNLRATQVEGNISLESVRGDVRAEGLTLKGTLKVEKANLKELNITEARVEGNMELSEVNLEGAIQAERLVLGGDLLLIMKTGHSKLDGCRATLPAMRPSPRLPTVVAPLPPLSSSLLCAHTYALLPTAEPPPIPAPQD